MNRQLSLQYNVQRAMAGGGMVYSVLQMAVLVFAAIWLLPVVGSPYATAAQRFDGYAANAHLLRVSNYLMTLPPFFFFIFLGGIYGYFSKVPESVKGILIVVVVSGSALIMLWPTGAVVSLLGVDIAQAGGDRITGGSFDSIVPYSLGLSTIPRAVFLICLSVMLLENRFFAMTGILIAAMGIIGTLILVSGKFLPFSLGSAVLFQIWIFALSYGMYRGSVVVPGERVRHLTQLDS